MTTMMMSLFPRAIENISGLFKVYRSSLSLSLSFSQVYPQEIEQASSPSAEKNKTIKNLSI
jgi:hypothetical protein